MEHVFELLFILATASCINANFDTLQLDIDCLYLGTALFCLLLIFFTIKNKILLNKFVIEFEPNSLNNMIRIVAIEDVTYGYQRYFSFINTISNIAIIISAIGIVFSIQFLIVLGLCITIFYLISAHNQYQYYYAFYDSFFSDDAQLSVSLNGVPIEELEEQLKNSGIMDELIEEFKNIEEDNDDFDEE